jgi:hypothetical protein
MNNLPYSQHHVYRKAALLILLDYGLAHRHGQQWIVPLSLLLAREGFADG